jgi:Ca2+-binding RTX toxin-like protein
LLRIFYEHAGAEAYARFWQALPSAPEAEDASDAFANFSSVARQASAFDFSFLFKSGWTFEVGGDAPDTLKAAPHKGSHHAVLGFSGNDNLVGSKGAETILSDYGNDSLRGLQGNDQLAGGSGNDALTGGAGRDLMIGGKGRDRFIFDDRHTGASARKADVILDFSGQLGDRINLKAIDANVRVKGDQAFKFIGEKDAFTKAGQVRYETTATDTWVYLNRDNDKAAEAVIRLKGDMDLSKGWFLL